MESPLNSGRSLFSNFRNSWVMESPLNSGRSLFSNFRSSWVMESPLNSVSVSCWRLYHYFKICSMVFLSSHTRQYMLFFVKAISLYLISKNYKPLISMNLINNYCIFHLSYSQLVDFSAIRNAYEIRRDKFVLLFVYESEYIFENRIIE